MEVNVISIDQCQCHAPDVLLLQVRAHLHKMAAAPLADREHVEQPADTTVNSYRGSVTVQISASGNSSS